MRLMSAVVHTQHSLPIPQGWVILGAVLTSWAMLAAVFAGATQLFQMLLMLT